MEDIGRYRIERQLAADTRGATRILLAHDPDRQRHVVLKQLRPEDREGRAPEELMALLRDHAEGPTLLRHAAVSRVRDVFQEEGEIYLSLDLVDGAACSELLARHGPMPLPEALRVVMDVLSGLGKAHQEGLAHGDVKLENVMIYKDGGGVLTDYGVLKDLAPPGATLEERWAGRLASLPPEILLGEEPTAYTDLYGASLVLFELLTGDAVFPLREGEDAFVVAKRRVEHPPPHLPGAGKHFPPELDQLLQRGLARDPLSRFESAADMVRSLISVAVRFRLEIPDLVPTGTIPARYAESRRRVERAMAEQGYAGPTEEEVRARARRTRLWRRFRFGFSTLVGAAVLGASALVLGSKGAYLAVGSLVPGTQVTWEGPRGARSLGETPVAMAAVAAGSGTLKLELPEDPPRVVAVPLVLPPRGLMQVDVGRRGEPATRLVEVPLPFPELPSWWPEWLGGTPGPLVLKAAAVDAQGDAALARRDLDEALRRYRKVVEVDPKKLRLAADRLVEAAWLRREAEPAWAEEALREAIGLDRDHERGLVILGGLLAARGDEQALYHLGRGVQRLAPGEVLTGAALLEASKARPEDPLVRRSRAHALRSSAPEKAVELYLALAEDRGWNRPGAY